MSADNSFSFTDEDRSELNHVALKGLTLTELLKQAFPPRENILHPWLPRQGLAMIYAPRGIGKTHVALNIAYAVASGCNYLNWKVSKPHNVLYIDGEMPIVAIQERLKSIAISSTNEASDRLVVLNPDLQEFGCMPDMATEDGQLAIKPYTDKADLIVVDNISTLCRRGKENEADSWILIQQWALKMRSEGRSVIFIHHAGKNGEQRGTSKREDTLDTVVSLKKPSDYSAEDGAYFEIHFEKTRNFYGDEAKPFKVKLLIDEQGRQSWQLFSVEDVAYKRMVELHNSGLQQSEIAKEMGVHKSTVSRSIKRAKEEGLISNQNRGVA